MTQTAEAVGGGEVEMGAAKDAVGTQWWRQQKCLLWRSSLPLMLNLDGFLGRPGKREVCVCMWPASARSGVQSDSPLCLPRRAPPKLPALPPFTGFSKRQQF